MEPILYVCKHCGKQMLELDESSIFRTIVGMMFSGHFESGVFVLQGMCKECRTEQQLIFNSTMILLN